MASYKTSGYKISDIYQGGYSSLAPPSEDASGGYTAAGKIGMAIDFRTANILQEVSSKLSAGTKNIEVSPIQPEVFDSIPKQQLKEVHRLSKLTGIDVSIHGPLIEASGVGQQGFSETERELAERKVTEALLRSHELNPNGNIPVTFHSTVGLPGSQFLPPSERKKAGTNYRKMIAANRENGRLIPLEPEIEYYPGTEKIEHERLPEERIKSHNITEWDNQLNQLFFNQERAKDILGKNQVQIQHLLKNINERRQQGVSYKQIFETMTPEAKQAHSNLVTAESYLQDLRQQANAFFSKAYKYGTQQQKDELVKLNEQFKKSLDEARGNPFLHAEAMSQLIQSLKQEEYIPNMYIPVEEFAAEKSSQTFGHAAFEAYKKFKDKAPLLVIENPPAGGGLSTSEGIKAIVEKSREKFVEAAKKEGMSESEAKKQAEKLIGVTWDVGHINMLRGQGYSEEEVIKETENVAPYVKHVHLSDNFGMEHTELPMGMGNVPFKEMLANLGQKGFEAKKIIEAGNWWQHFKTSPFQETLEATGSPIYSMKMAPYWAQAAGLYQGYFSGFGQMLPQVNYETFGAGFSRLPAELGGQSPGAQGGRMSGRPME